MMGVEGYRFGVGKRTKLFNEIEELVYIGEMKTSEKDIKYEYYLTPLDVDGKKQIKVRIVETTDEGVDGRIEMYSMEEPEEVEDDITSLILGLYPMGDGIPEDGEVKNGVRISGIPGRYTMEIGELTPLGSRGIIFNLEKNPFIPENFYSEIIYDEITGLLISISKVDSIGFLSIELKSIKRKE